MMEKVFNRNRVEKSRMRAAYVLILFLLAVFMASSCRAEEERKLIGNLHDLDSKDMRIGVVTGSAYDSIVETRFPNATLEYYNSFANMAYLVSQGQLDAFITDEPVARYISNSYPSIGYLDEFLGEAGYAFSFPKTEKRSVSQEPDGHFSLRAVCRRYT